VNTHLVQSLDGGVVSQLGREEPCDTPVRCNTELTATEFNGMDAVVFDAESPSCLNKIMVAKPNTQIPLGKSCLLGWKRLMV
jgi:hypothetical protein